MQNAKQLKDKFSLYFEQTYKGCFKTSWHFFNFILPDCPNKGKAIHGLLVKYDDFCKEHGVKRSWQGAIDWYIATRQGGEK